MRSHVRVSLLALVVSASVAVAAPAAQAAFSVESLFASNCQEGATCTATSTEGNHSEIFTQAAGHPPQGVTDFTIKSKEIPQTLPGQFAPEGNVKNIRTDVGPAESTNPESVAKCSVADFTGIEVATGVFTGPTCATTGPASTVIGENEVEIVAEAPPPAPAGTFVNVELEGKLYNLEQPNGLASYFGVALDLTKAGHPGFFAHTFLEGNIEWGKEAKGTNQGDYHDVYIIKNVTPGLIRSRINFKGNIGTGGFLTLPSSCTGTGPQTTTTLHVESYEGESAKAEYSGPLGTEGCKGEGLFSEVPFKPTFSLASGGEESQSDSPDGITTELSLPHDPSPTGIDSSQLENAAVTLPEGMTMNPSAARGLEACTPNQARIHSEVFGVECPSGSKLGTVSLDVPGLPAGSLTGNIYLGGPESGLIRGGTEAKPEYTMYLNAESKRYGVDVRLEGTVTPNPTTGQVTATFVKNPEQPFSNVTLKFNGGALAPIANPLVCGTATADDESDAVHRHRRAVAGWRLRRRRKRQRRRMRVAAAVLAEPEHRQPASGQRRREDLLHAQSRTVRRPAVPVADQDDPAGGPRRVDPVGAAVRRTAGEQRRMSAGQPDRRRRGGQRARARRHTRSPGRST